MSLNMWQIRNDTLHADTIMRDYSTQRRPLHLQTAIWYDKENEFKQDDRKYYHRPHLERLTDPNHLSQAWCVTMERLLIHTMNEYRRDSTLGRDIRSVFQPTPRYVVVSFQLLLR